MPSASKKGMGSKKQQNRDRRSSSRHSTPLTETAPATPVTSTPTTSAGAPALPKETPYLHTLTSVLISGNEPTIESLIGSTTGASQAGKNGGDPPTGKELHALHDKIKDSVTKFMLRRGEVCDRSMRKLAKLRKEREQADRERQAEEEARRQQEKEVAERKKAKKAGKESKGEAIKLSKKRSHDEMEIEQDQAERDREREERRDSLPNVGAHGLARQDGVGVNEGQPPPPSPKIQPGTVAADPMDTADSGSDSDSSPGDPPATIPLYERAFGKDPTQFDDPTIYDIRDWNHDMSDEELRAIFNVKAWPKSDLHDLTAGDPPDEDFSNAKPANQVNFTTFLTYAEPYIRPFNEEDVAFLKERGDRFTPFVIPQRGNRGYKDVWAAEDGFDGTAPPRREERRADEVRGSMEDMGDDIAETDEVSMGPVMNRLLSVLRPTPYQSGVKKEDEKDGEGDTSMLNGDNTLENGLGGLDTSAADNKPATYLPTDAPRPESLPNLDYEAFEQRAIQELRHIGFLSPNETPDYAAHNDDEVAARLRTLQHELRRVSTLNNVRKARVLELTEERMAMQEYSNIADDLDNQVNAAYLKRNRSLAKPSKSKSQANRPGQKGLAIAGAGAGARQVSDGVKALMQKRMDWINMVGPVVGYGRPPIPGDDETIFDPDNMRRLERVEKENELAEVEDN